MVSVILLYIHEHNSCYQMPVMFEHLLRFLSICRVFSILEGDNEVVHCNCSVSPQNK